ncbi:uncharacterized protein LOC127791242 [Diospyros lotus]|uniref:uncharacterized protein LOC127791242 n=1 Tax=Diospyros lotus TaxID=55363 RepID=UPI002255C7C9|nr:uncharacterized protein LOC127791242 [Diospyros lotus]
MGKQTRVRRPESSSYGKGNVTPVQIAFIVDRYLSDNNFTQTRTAFRSEASGLISKSPVNEAPKTLLTLGAILDEYIRLKEQKVMLDQEKCRLEQEQSRVQTLLRGMQDAMNVYNAGGSVPPPPVVAPGAEKSAPLVRQMDLTVGSPAGYPAYNTPVMMPTSGPSNAQTDPSNFSTPTANHLTTKRRKGSKDLLGASVAAKKSRSNVNANQLPVKGANALSQPSKVNNQENPLQCSAGQSAPHCNVLNRLPVQGSSVAKCLFNPPHQPPPTNLSVPKTPLQATSSQTDKSASPLETSTATSGDDVSPQQKTSTNCIVISSETITVSPVKQLTYYSIERNQCVSSPLKTSLKRVTKRDHVKGRLDFDGSDAPENSGKSIPNDLLVSEPDRNEDIFDLDLPSLDAFGMDFSLGDLLVDFDLEGGFACLPANDSSPNSHSGSSQEPFDLSDNQVVSELSSTVTEILSEKRSNTEGPESVTTVKSTTKSITILSPVKNHRGSCSDPENLSARS